MLARKIPLFLCAVRQPHRSLPNGDPERAAYPSLIARYRVLKIRTRAHMGQRTGTLGADHGRGAAVRALGTERRAAPARAAPARVEAGSALRINRPRGWKPRWHPAA